MSFKISSLSNPLSGDAFLNEGIRLYSHKPTFSNAPVVSEGEHRLEEETDGQEEVNERFANTSCS